MDAEIKKLADSKDLKSLKYIFVDSLDVDPTFVRYEEEYNYCKSIPGLLESHIELTPFSQNPSSWNEAYWTNLKMDLIKNFSDKRMMHMREVSKVFLAEKIQRILAERAATSKVATPSANDTTQKVVPPMPAPTIPKVPPIAQPQVSSKAAEQERELQETRERLEKERKAEEARIQAEKIRREQQRSNSQPQYHTQIRSNGENSKKFLGIAVAAVVVLVVVAILVLK